MRVHPPGRKRASVPLAPWLDLKLKLKNHEHSKTNNQIFTDDIWQLYLSTLIVVTQNQCQEELTSEIIPVIYTSNEHYMRHHFV